MTLLTASLAFADEAPDPQTSSFDEDRDDTSAEPAPAEDPPPAAAGEGPAPTDAAAGQPAGSSPEAEPAPWVDFSEAVQARDISAKDLKKFRPTRNLLPQVPRGQTDYTAYTLEWGEVELGLTWLAVGVLPGVQLSTVPVFYLPPLLTSGEAEVLPPVWNLQAKVDVLRFGPFDLAPQVNYYSLDWPGLDTRFLSVGGMASLVILPPWSIHAGGYWSSFDLEGKITEAWLMSLLGGVAGGDFGGASEAEGGDALGVGAELDTVTVRLATDVRFNRRDSLVLQAQALLWTSARFQTTLTADGETARLLDEDLAGFVDPSQAYLATLSYQATFRTVDLRVGIGVPFDNPAWALQAFELAWRFGGKTRIHEAKLQRAYKKNRTADDEEAVDAPISRRAAP